MNYFAHGREFIDDPYLLAGTAVPDWLNVVDRRVRVRSQRAATALDSADRQLRQIARGIVRHHADDAWFHVTPAFAELSYSFSARIREIAEPGDDGPRAWFLGHILVELLLDASLIRNQPERLDAYYRALDAVDPAAVAAAVNALAPRPAERMGEVVAAFREVRFLYDYLDDAKLCFRLNQVMRRVGLPELPARFAELLPAARNDVDRMQTELLTPAAAAEPGPPTQLSLETPA